MSSASGTKYAVVILIRSFASCSRVRNSVATSLQPTSEAPRTHCTSDEPGWGWSGKRSTDSSKSSGPVSAQLSRNAARSPSTAGPSMRKWVSRHSSSLRASPCQQSAMPTPPVNPTASSVISTLRWVRWLTWPGRSRRSGRNQWTCAPASSRRESTCLSMVCEPQASSSTPDADPRLGPVAQVAAELLADLAGPVDEGEEVDRVLGLVDGLEHRREDLVPVAEDLHAVALRGRDPEHPLEGATDPGCAVGGGRAVVGGRGSSEGRARSTSVTALTVARWPAARGP